MDAILDSALQYSPRLLAAAIVGGLVGLERELKAKPAGIRTNILMCLGSCLIMILSIETALRAGSSADPGRIAAQVVTGIGFLGAGTIIRSRVSVTGLTSAATIWFVAALGLVIGSGDFGVALPAIVLLILTLTTLNRLERSFEVGRQVHILELQMPRRSLGAVRSAMGSTRISADNVQVERTGEDHVCLKLEYVTRQKKHDLFIDAIKAMDDVEILVHY